MVPAFNGLGAPHWDMFARGMLIGLTRGTKRSHIIRACMEAIAYQSKDLLDAISALSLIHISAPHQPGTGKRRTQPPKLHTG